jgi:hypothetical protein
MNKALLDAILAKLAEDFPDTAQYYSPEVFADWLSKYQRAWDQEVDFVWKGTIQGPRHSVRTFDNLPKLSPTGRFPTKPEFQELPKRFGPSDLPMWEHFAPYKGTRYNKETTAEQLLRQSRNARWAELYDGLSAIRNRDTQVVGRNLTLDEWMNREWVLRDGNMLVSFAPATQANAAALVVAEQHKPRFGHLTVLEALTGDAAVQRARQYAAKAIAHDAH